GGTGGVKPARTRLVLVRHGQTDHNREGRLQGQVDIPLNETGIQQAETLAPAITANPPDVVVASPLSRAVDTARIITRGTRLEVTTDDAFLERGFGQWEGLRGEEIRARWPEEHADWRAHRPVLGLGVEDRPVVGQRVAEGCRALLAAHPAKTIMVVAHGAAITLGITALLDLDTNVFRGLSGLENCHRSVLEPLLHEPSDGRMRLVSHNLAPDFH